MSDDAGRKKEQLVLRTYERVAPAMPSMQYLTQKVNLLGDPFAVFCTNPGCAHHVEAESALPHWSEDCPLHLGVLRCPQCGAPVVRPARNPDA